MSESATPFQTVLETPFRVDSISPVAPPSGTQGDWYRYVIMQGPNADNAITGMRAGSLNEINRHLAEMVDQLNERFGKQQAKKR